MANSFIKRERIDQEVRDAIASALRKEAGDISMDASIQKDLGATSLDFLDINFRLENVFGVQLATQLLLDTVEEELGEGVAIDRDNKITAPAATLLRMHLGENATVEAGFYADEVPSLVTPKVIAHSVEALVGELPTECPSCGPSGSWESKDGAKVTCAACSSEAVYPEGDEMVKKWIHDVQSESNVFATK